MLQINKKLIKQEKSDIEELQTRFGTILPVTGTKINYGSYIIHDRILVLTVSVTATSNIARYNHIMVLSGGGKHLGGNAYIKSTDGKNCYIEKNNGAIAIYEVGGFSSGTTIKFEGVFPLNI